MLSYTEWKFTSKNILNPLHLCSNHCIQILKYVISPNSIVYCLKFREPFIFYNKPLYPKLCRDIWYNQQRWLCYMRIINRISSLYIFKVTKEFSHQMEQSLLLVRMDKFLHIKLIEGCYCLLVICGFWLYIPLCAVQSTIYFFINNFIVCKKWFKPALNFNWQLFTLISISGVYVNSLLIFYSQHLQ